MMVSGFEVLTLWMMIFSNNNRICC